MCIRDSPGERPALPAGGGDPGADGGGADGLARPCDFRFSLGRGETVNSLFLAQALVPVALILWMALAPPRSTLGFCIQFAASAACLWAAALLGIWLVPPWWAPWGFGAGLLLSLIHI